MRYLYGRAGRRVPNGRETVAGEVGRVMPVSFEIPSDYAEVDATYGKFHYTYADDTTADIIIDRDWIGRNIVTVQSFPGYNGMVRCHRLVEGPIREAMTLATARRPDYIVRKMTSFVPRHKLHNRAKPLSLHSWGVAVDINPDTNAYGTRGDLPDEFVEAFESIGFLWGGHFRNQMDAMHFQLCYRV